jgi:hypothetical protein
MWHDLGNVTTPLAHATACKDDDLIEGKKR